MTDNIGVMGLASCINSSFEIQKPSIESTLSIFKSGIGLDVSKNHTGVCMWRDGKVTTTGFALDMEYDKNCYMAEAKMRIEFKNKLKEILQGYNWEVCVVEDVYGGVNYDTTRKLLALNCVVDELVLEGYINIDYIYRLKEAEWLAGFRKLSNAGSKLNAKYECQAILEYLDFDFYKENKACTEAQKQAMFFEDICDATGQLCGLASKLIDKGKSTVKEASVRLSKVKMYYIESMDNIKSIRNKLVKQDNLELVELVSGNIEKAILDAVKNSADTGKVLYSCVSNSRLGTFGLRQGFTFYEQGYGYLIFYNKDGGK